MDTEDGSALICSFGMPIAISSSYDRTNSLRNSGETWEGKECPG